MSPFRRIPVSYVIAQHVSEVVSLRNTRTFLVCAPSARLHQLGRLDERLAANLDGLFVAGDFGRSLCMAALELPSRGSFFAATVGAIESRDLSLLERLIALAQTEPDARVGLVSAFGWVPAISLRGVTKELLNSKNPFRRDIGLAACAMHRVDPGKGINAAIADPGSSTQAVSVAGRLGRLDVLPACLSRLAHKDIRQQFESAQTALLLGDRQASLQRLIEFASTGGVHQARALALVVKVVTPARAHVLLGSLATDESLKRALLHGAGAAGDPHLIPWLIGQMRDLRLARLAGESFSMITGLDLGYLDLEAKPPEKSQFVPNDNSDDNNVAMDEDESLPWPDPDKVASWWRSNGHKFSPGTRYFMGAPPSPAHCLAILKTGFQRQRIAAAEYLSLMTPGTPLFNIAAPAWRQQHWLDKSA
jgi:uncharacterized protein (TIGR02270 family)